MSSITSLTVEEKASLGSGASFWESKSVGEVTGFVLTDGPHGVRKQAGEAQDALGISESAPATCFPPAVALGQAWNPELSERVGAALGDEAQAAGVGVLLGPGINIKRDPRCGRNFEYLSEDPLVSGILGAAWVRGLQGRGVGASVKHFAANNAETDRMRASSDVDARTLREIYLRAFQRVVAEAAPWTVMCSYNRINGVFASQNRWLLTEVLREQWGFDGVVVSDWGAVVDRPAAVAAGLDLEMPATGGRTDAQVVAAVTAGDLAVADVDRAAERVARLSSRIEEGRRADAVVDVDAHHRLAREAAAQSIVLLQNREDILPLRSGEPRSGGSIAVIGEFAQKPRYQGGGSSHVNPTRLDLPIDEIRGLAGGTVTYAAGFTTDGGGDAAALTAEAVDIARGSDTAVVFLGLGESQESEGFDRDDIDLPADQLAALEAVVAVQPRTVVVLSHGGVLRLEPVAALAPAILDGALLGQAGGGAIADVLFGLVNPSARLTETVPVRLEDVPAFVNFPGEQGHVLYGERIFVGYRWYDRHDLAVTFPFGHGLSYTRFAYSAPSVVAHSDGLTVTVEVTNTGDRPGREVVQVYAGLPASSISRARRGLVGFDSVQLAPGETRSLAIEIRRSDLAYWDVRVDRWIVESGEYELSVGASSRDLRGTVPVQVEGDPVWLPLSFESTMGELLADPIAGPIISAAMAAMAGGADLESMGAAMGFDIQRVMASMPIRATVGQTSDEAQARRFQQLLDLANAQHSAASDGTAEDGAAEDDETAVVGEGRRAGKGKPLTARSSVRAWLKHPVGGKLIRDLLKQGGVDERMLTAVKFLPLQQLVSLSGGQLPQSMVDDLVAKVGAVGA